VAEHRVFTSHQLTEIAFNHLDTAEDRLRTLTTRGVLDRFRPRRDRGSARPTLSRYDASWSRPAG
jgi:hypothetical protein